MVGTRVKLIDGGVPILCDGHEIFVGEDVAAALKWLGAQMRSGELGP
jgi:hypothetical protein